MVIEEVPFSLVFQLLEACPFDCGICHRRYEEEVDSLDWPDRRKMVQILKERGLRRLTVTGGEPMLLGKGVLDFLKYIHQSEIHVCLSTTGLHLNRTIVQKMDKFVDQLLISIPSLNKTDWIEAFGKGPTSMLLDTVFDLLTWIRETGIILEISTVVHKKNVSKIIDIGLKLLDLNPNIIWRVEQYYAMGIHSDKRSEFEIEDEEFDKVFDQVKNIFEGKIKRIRTNRRKDRLRATDYLITPSGALVTTSNNRYGKPAGNILNGGSPSEFTTRRPWSDYKTVCRDWGWSDL